MRPLPQKAPCASPRRPMLGTMRSSHRPTPLLPWPRADGFTLLELLVTIVVVGILLAVAAPSFLGRWNRAHGSVAQQYLTYAYRPAAADSPDYGGNFGGP